jgi:hypothetical protein
MQGNYETTGTVLERDPLARDRFDALTTGGDQGPERLSSEPLTLKQARTLALSILHQAEARRLQWAQQEADPLAIWEEEQ